MAGSFPPDYFGPDYFGPDYFGGETDPNALSAALAGTSSLTATLTNGAASNAPTFSPITFSSVTFSTRDQGAMSAALAGTSSVTGTLSNGAASNAPTFSPITFSSVTFSTRDQGAISASINGTAEFLATISVAAVAVEDDDSGYWARVVKKRRERKAKARKPVPGVLVAKIVGRSAITALGTAPRVGWPRDIYADIISRSTVLASIDGPDRIAEQDEQDLEDLTAILMLLAA